MATQFLKSRHLSERFKWPAATGCIFDLQPFMTRIHKTSFRLGKYIRVAPWCARSQASTVQPPPTRVGVGVSSLFFTAAPAPHVLRVTIQAAPEWCKRKHFTVTGTRKLMPSQAPSCCESCTLLRETTPCSQENPLHECCCLLRKMQSWNWNVKVSLLGCVLNHV